MHTHYRTQNDDSIQLSYCPLDLFSGNELRIEKAVRDLWDGLIDSKGSVNNLRVFVHGNMIKPGHVRMHGLHHWISD
jgi:inositol-pentakisphosphate 2-kinase